MSYGLEITNNNNQILISSDTRNLHFLGKAQFVGTITNSAACGGFQEHEYTIQCSVTPVPFFTMPIGGYTYAISGVLNTGGNNWRIRLINTGQFSTYFPEIYVFCDPRGISGAGGPGNTIDGASLSSTNTAGNLLDYASDPVGTVRYFQITNASITSTSVYGGAGGTYYNHDSNLVSAAIHAGAVSVGQTAIVKVIMRGYQATTIGSTANGITSYSYSSPWPQNYSVEYFSSSTLDQYGFVVYANDGTPSFDSRFGPLSLMSGGLITQPTNPIDGISGLSAQYCQSESTTTSSRTPTTYGTSVTAVLTNSQRIKPIFHYSSLAQCERRASFSESEFECDGFDIYGGCVGAGRTYYWTSTYWAFYRGGVAMYDIFDYSAGPVYSYTEFVARWIPVSAGCSWTYSKDSTFAFIPIGGASGAGGLWPYSNETLNMAPNAVIVSDGKLYD